MREKQDHMKRRYGDRHDTILIDNTRVRMAEWRFRKCGDSTGWHRHEHDYVVVPLFDGKLEIDLDRGQRTTADLKTGLPCFRETGVEHNAINGNDFE